MSGLSSAACMRRGPLWCSWRIQIAPAVCLTALACRVGISDPVSLTFCPYVVFRRPNRTVRDHPRITASRTGIRGARYSIPNSPLSSKQLFPSSGSRHRCLTFLLDRRAHHDARHLVRQCDGDRFGGGAASILAIADHPATALAPICAEQCCVAPSDAAWRRSRWPTGDPGRWLPGKPSSVTGRRRDPGAEVASPQPCSPSLARKPSRHRTDRADAGDRHQPLHLLAARVLERISFSRPAIF